jgi:mono/diheme cytochrome c family protein
MKGLNKKIFGSLCYPAFIGILSLWSSISVAENFPKAGDFQQGLKIWAENCGRCHNMRGPKDMRNDQWITTMFHMRVRAGLTGQETRDVLTFLQASNTSTNSTSKAVDETTSKPKMSNEPKAIKTASGKAIYQQNCIACHGTDGTGALPGVPDLTIKKGRLAKSDSTLIKNIIQGFQSAGSPMAMPPKGGNTKLTDTDIKEVVGYLRETFAK